MDAELRAASISGITVQRVVERYPLEPGVWLTLTPDADTWRVAIETDDLPIEHAATALAGTPSGSTVSGGARRIGSSDPIHGADALAHLLRFDRVPAIERFNLVRHAPTPEASGERPVDDDGQVVVVGERVVVSWARSVRDLPYTAPVNLAQLAAVDFLGVPVTYGLLIWTTPSGHEAPVAVVTKYLPRALDGRQSLISMLERGPDVEAAEMPPLSTRMGRIAAALHVALATRSSVLAEPVRPATTVELTDWHERIRNSIDRAALIAAEGTVPDLGRAFLTRLRRLEADADALLEAAEGEPTTLVQRVHGDLHVGRILRWAGGLMITGFGDEPERDAVGLGPQPAARDLARLMHSLDAVARQIDRQTAGRPGGSGCTDHWLPAARQRMITAYRTELGVAGRPELLDERLLAGFEAEHAAREVIEAARRQAAAESAAAEAVRVLEAGGATVWEQSTDRPW
jgi:maltokinase